MELRHLRYFVAVAEALSFTKAAENLRLAQPSLTRQIKDLEAEIEVRLIDRSGKGISLTQERVLSARRQAIAGRMRSKRASRATHEPYLYTEEEIGRLLEAARNLVTLHKLQPWTYYCLFGLLAVSGMRLGEALNLQPQDVDWSESVLTIRGAKFGKSRLVPLHPSTREVLLAYAERRDQVYMRRPVFYVFVSSHGTRLIASNVSKVFRDLSRQIGIRYPGDGHGPRLNGGSG